ncbi:MAG: response regulator [Desulfobacterales bacterium]|nr:response regulator [Desulfobacterales bacterium]
MVSTGRWNRAAHVRPLRKLLTRQFILIAVVPFLLAATLSIAWLSRQIKTDIQTFQHQLANAIASQVESHLSSAMITVQMTAAIPMDEGMNWHNLQHILDAQIESAPSLRAIYALSTQGRVMGIGLPAEKQGRRQDLMGMDLSRNRLFQQASQEQRPIWSDTFLSVVGGSLVVALAVPAKEMMVIGEIELLQLTDYLKRIPLPEEQLILVLDRHGQIVADRENRYTAQQLNIGNIPLVKAGLTSKTTQSGRFDFNYQAMLGDIVPTYSIDWFIMVAQPIQIAFGPLKTMLRLVLLGLGIALSIGIAFSILFSRRMARRFESLTTHARLVATSDTPSAWPKSSIAEFNELSESLAQMAVSIRNREQQRKEDEEKIRRSENNYRTLFEESLDTIFISTVEGKYLDINPMGVALLGYASKEEVLALDIFRDIYVNAEERSQLIHRLIQVGYVKDYQVRMKKKNGDIIDVAITATLIQNRANQPAAIRGIIRDITERKSLEEQLRQAQKMEAIGALAGGIAHDFNNLLTPILGYAEIMQSEFPAGSPLRESIDQVVSASNKAKDLVKQILTFSRQQPHEPRPVRIQHVLNEAVRLLRASIPKSIEIKESLLKSGFILADPGQIHQVIINLCTNAYHAMRDSGGAMGLEVKEMDVGPEVLIPGLEIEPGRYVRLEVSDTGIGMDEKTKSRIFDPYFTTKKPGEGTGLGLAVVHGIVKHHKGHITVYSEPGRGTIFHVYFPAVGAQGTAVAVPSVEQAPRGHERILIVDDEKPIVQLQKSLLESLGYRVTALFSSMDALQMFTRRPDDFDLVITDMTMPGMNGALLSRELLKLRKDLPIILCTGFSELIDEDKARALGIRRYVMKPIVRAEIARVIREILDGPAATTP